MLCLVLITSTFIHFKSIEFCLVLIVLSVFYRVLQDLWGSRALRGPLVFRGLRGLQERRVREEMRGQVELQE